MEGTYSTCFMLSCSVMSDSLWLNGLQPATLFYPWDSLGKNIGVGCHALLQDLPNPGIEPVTPAFPILYHRATMDHLQQSTAQIHTHFNAQTYIQFSPWGREVYGKTGPLIHAMTQATSTLPRGHVSWGAVRPSAPSSLLCCWSPAPAGKAWVSQS